MTNPTLRMSQNWNNKLDCKVFPTFRKFNEAKYLYYKRNFNQVFDILLNKRLYCQAKLISIKVTPYRLVPLETLMLDTGYTTKEAIDMLFQSLGVVPDDDVIWLYFKRWGA